MSRQGRVVVSKLILWVALLLLSYLSAPDARAQLSPGELHRSHESLEGVENCKKCHGSGKSDMTGQCLKCHTAIMERQKSGQGLHAQPDYENCVLCHVEHHGRDFDLIYFKDGRKWFDHSKTGYVLSGGHDRADCRDCHRPRFISNPGKFEGQSVLLDSTFLGLDTNCLSCHVDQHRGQLPTTCSNCHNYDKWKPATQFDHNRTEYPLAGRHAKVECNKCHPPLIDELVADSPQYVKYKDIRHQNCFDCHKDPHEGRLGKTCDKCHTADGWKIMLSTKFDHDKTRYLLRGRHVAVECKKCHRNTGDTEKLKFAACMDCHTDYHEGAFKKRVQKGTCEECHTVDGYRPALFTIAQHEKTDYPIKGAHMAVACFQCHQTGTEKKHKYTFNFKTTRCLECHRDPHQGQVKKLVKEDGCESCHIVEAWAVSTFDHNKTKFKLTGRHKTVKCIACHKSTSDFAKDISFATLDTLCQGCHKNIHGDQFAEKSSGGTTACIRCHGTDNWQPGLFDHKKDARFVLDGAHAWVPCEKCHFPKLDLNGDTLFVIYKPVDTACAACHAPGSVKGVE